MRVLMLTNLFPTYRSPHGAVFIRHRIEAHTKAGTQMDVVALQPHVTPLLRPMLARTGRDDMDMPAEVNGFRGVVHPMRLSDWITRSRKSPSERLLCGVARAVEASVDVETYDIIHAHGMYAVAAGAVAQTLSRRRGLPYVVTCHGSDVNVLMPNMSTAFARVLNSASGVTFVSNSLRKRAEELGHQNANTAIIPNGVDTDAFTPDEALGGGVEDSPIIGVVAGLFEIKGG